MIGGAMRIVVLMAVVLLAVLLYRQSVAPTKVDDAPTSTSQAPTMPTWQVKDWQAPAKRPTPFADMALLSVFGGAATKETALDFAGNTAVRYRYHTLSEPPLYVVDSKDFFEVAWYYSYDYPEDTSITITHAKIAYALSHQILGSQATTLMGRLLTKQSASLPAGVVHAECQAHLCQMVFEKGMF